MHEHGNWKIWLLCTILEHSHGFPDADHLVPGLNVHPSSQCYDYISISADTGGLCMAGHLKALSLSYAVIDQHEAVGDCWVKDRYDSVKLHVSRCHNQMPGSPKTCRPEDPYPLPSQDLKQGLQRYVDTPGLEVKTPTSVSSAEYDARSRLQNVLVKCKGQTE